MSERGDLISALPPHEAEELFRLMVEDIKECAVFLMNPSGIITVWNKSAEEIKGYSAEEAIGQHLSLLYTEEDNARGWPAHNLKAAATDGFFREESWRKRKDGSLFWALISLTALRDENDNLLGFSKVTMDLTRHKLLEQSQKEQNEINRILRLINAGTWKWNIQTDEVEISPHFATLLDVPRYKSVLHFDEWIHYVNQADRKAALKQLLAVRDQAPHAKFEAHVRINTKDDSFRWFYVCADWYRETLGAPMMLMGVCVDIHDLKAVQDGQLQLIQQLREERNRYAHILDQLPSAIILAEAPSGKLTYQNRAAERILGRGLAAIDSYHDYGAYHCIDVNGKRIKAEDLPLARTIINGEARRTEEIVYERPDGSRSHCTITTASILDSDGVSRVAVAVMHDVSNLKEAQLSSATEKERAQVTLAAITDGVIATDTLGAITSINPVAEYMTGWKKDDALGISISSVVQLGDESGNKISILESVQRCLVERKVVHIQPHATLTSKDGQRHSIESEIAPIALSDGNVIGTVHVFHDVSESRRLVRRLSFEASHDALTGLVNRREFEARLKRTLERAKQSEHGAALLYMDLDQFKIVNDTCGHSAGDELLNTLAQVYWEHVRDRDTLARIGGDEFALIIEHCSIKEAVAVADKILEATRNFRYSCKGRMFQLGVSIGLIPIDANTGSMEEALRQADHACYVAKETGRNRIYVHKSGASELALRHNDMHWITRLQEAFQNDQLQLYFQPIVPIDDSNAGMHYEILLRLKNGNNDPIRPGKFLPAAERYDVMPSVDRWVLKKSLDWLGENPEHLADLKMCTINLSRRTLADQTFQQYAADLLDATIVPADKLCFEITENGAIANMQKTISFINALSERGCHFSLDDFGTGMTSFAYLKQLPVDFIKIDGSFIQKMLSSEIDYEMVRFTNDISHMMGRQTIAEYVTDQSILSNLKDLGVDFAQGYLIGKPQPLTA
jgi:diguanylate cyclase (GGDEF)-like protein/PAS domain S-box-containing protein